jgi:cystathionine beta-synthase
MKNPELRTESISTIMQDPFPFVEADDSVEAVSSKINRNNSAVLVKDSDDTVHIITKQDIISGLR